MRIFRVRLLLAVLATGMFLQANAQNITSMDAFRLQYKIAGEGKPLVLIPGGLTGWVSWGPFVPDFSANNRVVQVQLLSVQYGLEDKTLPADYSVSMESEALAESLKEAGLITPADFIGWSFGAFVLLDFALNYPHLIRSLTLIEPPAFWVLKAHGQVSTDAKHTMDFLNTLTGDISEKQLNEFMTTVGFAPPGTSLQEHPQWDNWVKHRRSLRNSGQVVEHEDDPARLQKFDRPVLLVKGAGSASFLHEIIDLLAQDLQHAQTVTLPEGHAPHLVSKSEFQGIVREFQEQSGKQ